MSEQGRRPTRPPSTGRAATALALPAERLCQLLYPIPSSERTIAPGLTQNPGCDQ